MRLMDEIFKNPEGVASARCTFVVGGGGYFEDVKAVGEFSPERIVLCFPRDNVEIEGQNLSIGKYCDGDLRVDGKILSLRLLLDGGR